MGTSVRNIVSLLAALLWAAGCRRLFTSSSCAAATDSGSRILIETLCDSHSIRRFNRSEEFISVFLFSGWRIVPCPSEITRGSPPGANPQHVLKASLLSIGDACGMSRWKIDGC
jgi:hypothetical protein